MYNIVKRDTGKWGVEFVRQGEYFDRDKVVKKIRRMNEKIEKDLKNKEKTLK